jgi:hypothetical protein
MFRMQILGFIINTSRSKDVRDFQGGEDDDTVPLGFGAV